jgi:hypothetical protein
MARRKPARGAPSADDMMAYHLRNRANIDASIDRDIERSCTSKQPYASEGEARAVMAMNGMKLFTYHCRYCDCWHLTRRPTGGGDVLLDE